jgi:tetratricopeptide (TPR) repeat protein
MRGIGDAKTSIMRNNTVLAFVFLVACAPSTPHTRSSARASRTAGDAAAALTRGEYASALSIAEFGLRSDKNDPWLLYNKGVAQAGLGMTDDALATLSDAEAAFSDAHNRSLAIYKRALVLEFAGRCPESSAEMSRYAALVAPHQPQLANDALAHLQYCISPSAQQVAAQEQVQPPQPPTDEMRRAQQLSTDATRALIAADYDVALARANSGLELVPDDPWLVYNKGAALAGLGRYAEAETTLRHAERLFPASNIHGRSVAVYRRAMALEMADRCDELAAELRHFVEITNNTDPNFAANAMAHVRTCKLARSQRGIY